AERERYAEERKLEIAGRRCVAVAHDRDAAAKRRHQLRQLRLHLQHHRRAARGEKGRKAGEHDRVAEALLGVEQKTLASEVLAAPLGRAENARPPGGAVTTRFVFRPAGAQIALLQQEEAAVETAAPVTRIERQDPVVSCQRLSKPPERAQRRPAV